MATIDIDALKDHLRKYFGAAMRNGYPVAILDISELDTLSDTRLCQLAETEGVDLRPFRID